MRIIALAMKFQRFFFGILIAAGLVVGCGPSGEPDPAEGKLKVVSTTGMINDIVKQIGGDRVYPVALMGPGVDPHLYRPTAEDVQKLESANLIFVNGLDLEGRMAETLAKINLSEEKVKKVSEYIDPATLIKSPSFAEGKDPHFWFDPTMWRKAVAAVARAIAREDELEKVAYARRADTMQAELDALDSWIMEQVAQIPLERRVLVTAHDAFGYFGARYGFRVLGIQGTNTAAEASPQTIKTLADDIAKHKIKAIFVESSVPKGTVEALQEAVKSRGWNVKIGGQLFSDAMGEDGTPEGTYIGMVKHNVNTIVQALK